MNTEHLIKNAKYAPSKIEDILIMVANHLDPGKTGEYVGEAVQEITYVRRINSYQVLDEINILTIDEDVYKKMTTIIEKAGYSFEHQFEDFDDGHGWYATNVVFSQEGGPSLWLRCYGFTKGHAMIKSSRSENCYMAQPI